ncbi:hypothetical protein Sango_1884800 [Sesamum angolense]|uniref:Uncharacterized protein n=1 Tax=Sesamum angolense TaxID=2727404 RepID=A0AAE1WIR5_9LAMI|nr:hypothetical protein Sango_1884800 [Sesamum angolense]
MISRNSTTCQVDDAPHERCYAVPDRHVKYAAIKAFFGRKMIKGSSVQKHGIKMFSLVEKLEDLQDGFDNDTYIDVLQLFLPSYESFVLNYNMNEFEKSIHKLINMLVHYKTTIKKSAPSILVEGALTSKAKSKGPDAGKGI